MDGELGEGQSAEVRFHVAACPDCALICEDLASLVNSCETYNIDEASPPNSQALWCRINNLIETENQTIKTEAAKQPKKAGFWERMAQRSWRLSFPQVVTVVLGVAVVSSLLTVIGIKNSGSADTAMEMLEMEASGGSYPTLVERLLGRAGLIETKIETREKTIKEKEAIIEYWNKRVQARRAEWDKQLRETFDRNLREIDQVVIEYSNILSENPRDTLSEEMLNSALNEKVDLLREFAEL